MTWIFLNLAKTAWTICRCTRDLASDEKRAPQLPRSQRNNRSLVVDIERNSEGKKVSKHAKTAP